MRLMSVLTLSAEKLYLSYGKSPTFLYLVKSLCRHNWPGSLRFLKFLYTFISILEELFLAERFYSRSIRLSLCLSS